MTTIWDLLLFRFQLCTLSSQSLITTDQSKGFFAFQWSILSQLRHNHAWKYSMRLLEYASENAPVPHLIPIILHQCWRLDHLPATMMGACFRLELWGVSLYVMVLIVPVKSQPRSEKNSGNISTVIATAGYRFMEKMYLWDRSKVLWVKEE